VTTKAVQPAATTAAPVIITTKGIPVATTTAPAPTPRLIVRGKDGLDIPSGSFSAKLSDGTDFGIPVKLKDVNYTLNKPVAVFSLVNSGTQALSITAVNISKDVKNPCLHWFNLASISLPAVIEPGSSLNISIEYIMELNFWNCPSQENVTVTSTDARNSPYSFAIQAQPGTAFYNLVPTELTVYAIAGGPSITRNFYFTWGDGNMNITLTGNPKITITGPTASFFEIVSQPNVTVIVPGGPRSRFSVKFTPPANVPAEDIVATLVIQTDRPWIQTDRNMLTGVTYPAGSAPEMSIVSYWFDNTVSSGQTGVSFDDGTLLGILPLRESTTLELFFTIRNTGASALTVTDISLPTAEQPPKPVGNFRLTWRTWTSLVRFDPRASASDFHMRRKASGTLLPSSRSQQTIRSRRSSPLQSAPSSSSARCLESPSLMPAASQPRT
jgi:hypothetical protein